MNPSPSGIRFFQAMSVSGEDGAAKLLFRLKVTLFIGISGTGLDGLDLDGLDCPASSSLAGKPTFKELRRKPSRRVVTNSPQSHRNLVFVFCKSLYDLVGTIDWSAASLSSSNPTGAYAPSPVMALRV